MMKFIMTLIRWVYEGLIWYILYIEHKANRTGLFQHAQMPKRTIDAINKSCYTKSGNMLCITYTSYKLGGLR